jgi:hypothetical protein
VEIGDVLTQDRSFPKGTYVVPTAQFLGRLVAHMLEPETDDNVVYWNTMDAWLPRPADPATEPGDEEEERGGAGAGRPPGGPPGGFGGGFFRQQGPPVVPIFKLMTPVALPTRIMD